jgi:hypothetical protein
MENRRRRSTSLAYPDLLGCILTGFLRHSDSSFYLSFTLDSPRHSTKYSQRREVESNLTWGANQLLSDSVRRGILRSKAPKLHGLWE